MYVDHPVFEGSSNPNAKIWRYMDFTKFIALLETKSLFFTRSDKFEDPYEGRLNQITIDYFKEEYYNSVQAEENIKELAYKSIVEDFKESRKQFTVNCWHMNEFESDAMWKLYLKSNEGIAIQSTFQKLCDSFSLTEEEIYIGKVVYKDFNKYIIPINNNFYRFLVKRKSFEHEREIRAIHWRINSKIHKASTMDEVMLPTVEYGENMPVDIRTLIEKVYVAPNSPIWITDLVRSMLKKYDLQSVSVEQSSLGYDIDGL